MVEFGFVDQNDDTRMRLCKSLFTFQEWGGGGYGISGQQVVSLSEYEETADEWVVENQYDGSGGSSEFY